MLSAAIAIKAKSNLKVIFNSEPEPSRCQDGSFAPIRFSNLIYKQSWLLRDLAASRPGSAAASSAAGRRLSSEAVVGIVAVKRLQSSGDCSPQADKRVSNMVPTGARLPALAR